jgi:hypothetical protein
MQNTQELLFNNLTVFNILKFMLTQRGENNYFVKKKNFLNFIKPLSFKLFKTGKIQILKNR